MAVARSDQYCTESANTLADKAPDDFRQADTWFSVSKKDLGLVWRRHATSGVRADKPKGTVSFSKYLETLNKIELPLFKTYPFQHKAAHLTRMRCTPKRRPSCRRMLGLK